ncbi:hypothetical protein [Anaerobacillus alkalidiazotrophicus]|nr:hypothetical protein [Anaerobacillus alkalidiazotrophicus]
MKVDLVSEKVILTSIAASIDLSPPMTTIKTFDKNMNIDSISIPF